MKELNLYQKAADYILRVKNIQNIESLNIYNSFLDSLNEIEKKDIDINFCIFVYKFIEDTKKISSTNIGIIAKERITSYEKKN